MKKIIFIGKETSICIIFIIMEVCVRLHNFSLKRMLYFNGSASEPYFIFKEKRK